MVIYRDYAPARIGLIFGMTGKQLLVLAVASAPVWVSINAQRWWAALMFVGVWVVVATVTVVPVRGRSAVGWLGALTLFAWGTARGWTRFTSRAAAGRVADLNEVDLPGVMSGIEVLDGPPSGLMGRRPALIQNHADKTWTITAAVVHAGIGLREADERARYGRGLSDLLDAASKTELVSEVLVVVRTIPEDGAERDQWIARHRRGEATPARAVNDALQAQLTQAAVRTETFISLVVPETRLARQARHASGRGSQARAQVLVAVAEEMQAHLQGALGMSSVTWLTSPELAAAVRTGFAPGDRVGIIDAAAVQDSGEQILAQVPWAMAGPSGATPAVRHYEHDAWSSVSATLTWPEQGAAMGALKPVLTPSGPHERRAVLVAYPILGQAAAARQTATSQWLSDLGGGLRDKVQVRVSTREQDQGQRISSLEAKVARGASVSRPYVVATITVPRAWPIAEYGRRLDAAIRRAGFAPQRLDLAQDRGFASSTVPLGISLTRSSDA